MVHSAFILVSTILQVHQACSGTQQWTSGDCCSKFLQARCPSYYQTSNLKAPQ